MLYLLFSAQQSRKGWVNKILFSISQNVKRGDFRTLFFNEPEQQNNALKQEIRSVVALTA